MEIVDFLKANYDTIYRGPYNKKWSEYLLTAHGWIQYRCKKAYILHTIIYQTCPIRDLTSHNMLIRTVTDCMFFGLNVQIYYILQCIRLFPSFF
jgi:hypothetical protein